MTREYGHAVSNTAGVLLDECPDGAGYQSNGHQKVYPDWLRKGGECMTYKVLR